MTVFDMDFEAKALLLKRCTLMHDLKALAKKFNDVFCLEHSCYHESKYKDNT
jgi:hypothetical protein